MIHSLTKFIGGHGTTLGVSSSTAALPVGRHPDRFAIMIDPEPAFHGVDMRPISPTRPYSSAAGRSARATPGPAVAVQRVPTASGPRDAGRSTAPPRGEHAGGGRFSGTNPRVSSVSFLGLPTTPTTDSHAVPGGPCPLDHDLHRPRRAGSGDHGVQQVNLFKRLLNMGDAKSLITHPAWTTHRQLTPYDLKLAGITPDMVRLSVGLEHPDDLIEDLDQALLPPRVAAEPRPRHLSWPEPKPGPAGAGAVVDRPTRRRTSLDGLGALLIRFSAPPRPLFTLGAGQGRRLGKDREQRAGASTGPPWLAPGPPGRGPGARSNPLSSEHAAATREAQPSERFD